MKKIAIFFLVVVLLTSATISRFGLKQSYVMRPYEYVERIKNVIENGTSTETPEIDFDVIHDKGYQSVYMSLPTWTPVNVDGITDVIPAVGRMFSSLANYVGGFFREFGNLVSRLWNNFLVFGENVLGLIPKFISYFGKQMKNMFAEMDYVKCLLLSFVPLDWEEMQIDGVDLKDVFFGWLLKPTITRYFIPAGGS